MAELVELREAVAGLVSDGDSVELEEHSHAAMANRYVAGASNVPFAVAQRVLADHDQQPEAKRDAPEW